MVRFEKLAPTEKAYPFEDAIVASDYKNGTFGSVADGTFTAGEGFQAIMQVENGDDMMTDNYKVVKGEHARIVDFSKADGAIVNITADNITGDYAGAKAFEVDAATGLLKKADSLSGNGFTVIELTRYGARATVTLADAE